MSTKASPAMLLIRHLCAISLFVCSYAVIHENTSNYSSNNPVQPESSLMGRLLSSYDPKVRPIFNLTCPIDVHVTFTPIRIDDLDLHSEVIKITGWITMVWTDNFLQWNPREEHNITCLLFHREDIWVPPLSVINSMRGMFVTHDKTHYNKARVCWNGVARYVIMDNYVLSCDVDINYFPFDQQTCTVKVMSWYHPEGEVQLTALPRDMDRTHYQRDGEWSLRRTAVLVTEFNSSSHPFGGVTDRFSLVVFSLTVLRRPMYYVVNVLLPCIMLCVLVLINFLLPPDSGEKVSLGITVLLSFTVFQLLIAEIVPTSAICTPKLAVFLICIMATSTSSIVVSVLVLHLHHRAVCTQPPTWLRTLVLEVLARLLGMHNSHVMKQHRANMVQPLVSWTTAPDSKDCCTTPASAGTGTGPVGNQQMGLVLDKTSAADAKFRLNVVDNMDPPALDEGGNGWNQLRKAADLDQAQKMADLDQQQKVADVDQQQKVVDLDQQRKMVDLDQHLGLLQARNSDLNYRSVGLARHRPNDHVLGGSEHRLMSVGGLSRTNDLLGDITRARSSGGRQPSCRSLNLNPDCVPAIFPLQTKSALRLIQSINTLAAQAGTLGTTTPTTTANPDAAAAAVTATAAAAAAAVTCTAERAEMLTSSQQEFVHAVREVYHELRETRLSCELEHAMENEWRLIARVVDRLFFWITFLVLLVTSLGVFVGIPWDP